MDKLNPNCSEASAYPAHPDSEYGWEKLFSERLYLSFARKNRNVKIRIARFHNIFGPLGTYKGGKEKSPAAFCRKIASAKEGDIIDMWGDGTQTRSYLFIDECLEGIKLLMDSDFEGPVNIGSEEMVSINGLVEMIAFIAKKKVKVNRILDANCLGVKGRRSDNKLIREKLKWEPKYPLVEGLKKTYAWIEEMVKNESDDVLPAEL
jgi:nucleoside-diphosphate-sugar epimerase